jgi:hypothetical protein
VRALLRNRLHSWGHPLDSGQAQRREDDWRIHRLRWYLVFDTNAHRSGQWTTLTISAGRIRPKSNLKDQGMNLSRHREMLAISCLIIIASFLLRVHPDKEKVGLQGVNSISLPPLCLSYEWFGIRCPGCGLTRSFIFLAHGDLQASMSIHPLGWLLACAVLLQIPYRIHAIYVWPRNLISLAVRERIGWLLIGLLICNWVIQIMTQR